jgi:uncharacterized glyoxalase superfamily protein PhnB
VLGNRSMPADPLVPVLAYPSVPEAVDWLVAAFGFTRRWQAGDHRAQLGVGGGAVAVTSGAVPAGADHVMVRVEDVTAHRERARAAGAEVGEIGEHAYGERQYTATDHAGRRWVFSQSVADVDPRDWGATVGEGE